jgi:hypothetical protein
MFGSKADNSKVMHQTSRVEAARLLVQIYLTIWTKKAPPTDFQQFKPTMRASGDELQVIMKIS